VRRLLIGLGVFVLVLFLMSGWIANRVMFYPMRYPDGDWEAQRSVGAEDRWMRASDGTRLNAWWFPSPPGSRLATLFLHGNAGNVTHRVGHARMIIESGSAVMLLDYRGYGRSEGSPSETGMYRDADAAYDELVRMGFEPARIVLYGESLGTAAAVDLGARRPCAGLILEAPMSSAQDVASGILPLLGPLLVRGLESKRKIVGVRAPVFVIHGDRDNTIPFALGKSVFEAAHEPKWFWPVPGGSHVDLLAVAGKEYVARLREFYGRLAK
jgi:fermentation-respiration switch protein FrsA (DUF1100 family)